MSALSHLGTATAPPPASDTARVVGGRKITPFLLLLPGVAWLIIFFVVPMVQLFTVSLRSNFPGYPGYYYRDLNFGNYWRVWTEFAPHFGRSLLLASIATFLAFLLAYPLACAMAFVTPGGEDPRDHAVR